MITLEDLNPHERDLTSNQESNLETLATLLTLLEDEFKKSPGGFLFEITSGFRSMEDQYKIYRAKGISTPPLGSKHMTGQAADISDPVGVLARWVQNEGLPHLEKLNLYCEDPAYTKKWLHVQDSSPASRKRFFIP